MYPITPNSPGYDRLIIMGGRDSGQMFQDVFVLDLAKQAWDNAQGHPGLDSEVARISCTIPLQQHLHPSFVQHAQELLWLLQIS